MSEDLSTTLQPHSSEPLAKQYRSFDPCFDDTPIKILYPCCQNDTTPTLAFPSATVTYVDMNRIAVRYLLEAGFNAHLGRVPTGREQGVSVADTSDVPQYVSHSDVDLLILLNPQISPDAVIQWVRNRGFVLCNNYHRTADEIVERCTSFILRAVLRCDDPPILDRSGLNEYFQYVETDEEFRDNNSSGYEVARNFMQRWQWVLPAKYRSSVMPDYKKIVEGKPNMFGNVTVRKLLKEWRLPVVPRKKYSSADDLFLFQREEQ